MTRKTERPLYLDMPLDEALTRYIGTKAEEVEPPPGRKRKAAKLSPRGQVVDDDASSGEEAAKPEGSG